VCVCVCVCVCVFYNWPTKFKQLNLKWVKVVKQMFLQRCRDIEMVKWLYDGICHRLLFCFRIYTLKSRKQVLLFGGTGVWTLSLTFAGQDSIT
jgi:hypothetical protein